MRREKINAIRVVMKMNVERNRRSGRSKKRWLNTIENDMRNISECVEDVENRDE
jgi:hypothetical protein